MMGGKKDREVRARDWWLRGWGDIPIFASLAGLLRRPQGRFLSTELEHVTREGGDAQTIRIELKSTKSLILGISCLPRVQSPQALCQVV